MPPAAHLRSPRAWQSLATVVLAAAVPMVSTGFVATAGAPAPAAQRPDNASRLVSDVAGPGQKRSISVYSASMDKEIPLDVLRPKDTSTPAPTLYLLNGTGGGTGKVTWEQQTDIAEFFAGKHVNVVTPQAGFASYYTDWLKDDPVLGRNKWTTFLTKELPPIIDAHFGANGENAITGMSMSGTSVLSLAISAPGLYNSVASFSGCAMTSDPVGQRYVELVVENRGKGNSENMWGPKSGQGWKDNDPFVNAEKLRGVPMYIASRTGAPGQYDTFDNPRVEGNPVVLANQIVVGGVIEAATNECTHRLSDRLDALGIPATFAFEPTGSHSWGYWQDDLHKAWPMLARSMNLEP
ncbi:alpha/beta hydrolase [Rhodococcus maanshanensis]|uniref:S-formylglutathione hydrolase FrmB n=1 Tax=Rhodococcus maanshanensis TaxID=183556 RepID=A0A1H7IVW0_9NOCA|nr:alpha/beta hydrolase family protein [Rhodococcus maanshanensis]SEK66653.1 S-formylglutathione hydrolase FrmB [Rhodococcus maanshanensis]